MTNGVVDTMIIERASTTVAGGTPRVLVAEDHAEMADVLRTYLEAAGYDVRVARDGVEAAELTARFAPTVVVLDANMPGWNGWALLAAWKGAPLPPGAAAMPPAPQPARVPAVVMLTGDDVFPAVASEADAILRKPAALRTIAAVVAQQLAARAEPGGATGVR
jgi:CheY-like chemotaxis protein